MKPSLGRVVIYVRAQGEEFAGQITIVRERAGRVRGLELPDRELDFDVWISAAVHEVHEVVTGWDPYTWYSPSPVKFDGSETPATNTWHWPPRV